MRLIEFVQEKTTQAEPEEVRAYTLSNWGKKVMQTLIHRPFPFEKRQGSLVYRLPRESGGVFL